MDDRFSPGWRKVEPCLDSLITSIERDDHLLVEAFLSVAQPGAQAQSAAEVKSQLHGIVIAPGTPWVLYETISALLLSLPVSIRRSLTQDLSIPTGRSYERLQVDVDGRWQVAWQIDPNSEPEYQYVALDWYVPKERERAPIVPLYIVDYIAGGVSLLRSNLIIPAAAVLFIALESVLWEDLEAKGISRVTERVVYAPATWNFKIVGGQLVVSIRGAERQLQELKDELGPARACGIAESRRLRNEGNRGAARIELDSPLIACLTSSQEESRESVPERGLAEAIQRARPAGVLATVPVQLDETLYRLRNALIHLPSDGRLVPPVPDSAGNLIGSLDALKQHPQFIVGLAHIIVNLINGIYAR